MRRIRRGFSQHTTGSCTHYRMANLCRATRCRVTLSPNLTVSEVSPKMRAWPRRLEVQDTALSRPRHGFESRRGHLSFLVVWLAYLPLRSASTAKISKVVPVRAPFHPGQPGSPVPNLPPPAQAAPIHQTSVPISPTETPITPRPPPEP